MTFKTSNCRRTIFIDTFWSFWNVPYYIYVGREAVTCLYGLVYTRSVCNVFYVHPKLVLAHISSQQTFQRQVSRAVAALGVWLKSVTYLTWNQKFSKHWRSHIRMVDFFVRVLLAVVKDVIILFCFETTFTNKFHKYMNAARMNVVSDHLVCVLTAPV